MLSKINNKTPLKLCFFFYCLGHLGIKNKTLQGLKYVIHLVLLNATESVFSSLAEYLSNHKLLVLI